MDETLLARGQIIDALSQATGWPREQAEKKFYNSFRRQRYRKLFFIRDDVSGRSKGNLRFFLPAELLPTFIAEILAASYSTRGQGGEWDEYRHYGTPHATIALCGDDRLAFARATDGIQRQWDCELCTQLQRDKEVLAQYLAEWEPIEARYQMEDALEREYRDSKEMFEL